jgi:hypothetical protein
MLYLNLSIAVAQHLSLPFPRYFSFYTFALTCSLVSPSTLPSSLPPFTNLLSSHLAGTTLVYSALFLPVPNSDITLKQYINSKLDSDHFREESAPLELIIIESGIIRLLPASHSTSRGICIS